LIWPHQRLVKFPSKKINKAEICTHFALAKSGAGIDLGRSVHSRKRSSSTLQAKLVSPLLVAKSVGTDGINVIDLPIHVGDRVEYGDARLL
jgi:hypothetical protein